MLNQRGGSRTDTLVKLVLIFFISLLSFSVGTFVGKQFSDSQHKMAALESGEGGDRETAAVNPDELDVKPEDALTDQDVADLADEFIKEEKHTLGETAGVDEHRSPADDGHKADTAHGKHPASTGAAATATKPTAEHGHTDTKAVEQVAEKIANGKPGFETVHKAVKVDPNLPKQVASDAVGRFTVQLSSHNNVNDAETRAKEFQEKGYNAFSVPAQIKGSTWYRVSVGLFSDRKAADEYRRKLISDGVVKDAIVSKIVEPSKTASTH